MTFATAAGATRLCLGLSDVELRGSSTLGRGDDGSAMRRGEEACTLYIFYIFYPFCLYFFFLLFLFFVVFPF